MGGVGGRETPLALAEGFPFPQNKQRIVLTGPSGAPAYRRGLTERTCLLFLYGKKMLIILQSKMMQRR